MSVMMKPIIHSNGTSGEELVRFYEEAAQALSHARDALMFACPNGRDYYPQGQEAYDKAHAEHMARVQKILDVRSELQALAEYVQDELDKRFGRSVRAASPREYVQDELDKRKRSRG